MTDCSMLHTFIHIFISLSQSIIPLRVHYRVHGNTLASHGNSIPEASNLPPATAYTCIIYFLVNESYVHGLYVFHQQSILWMGCMGRSKTHIYKLQASIYENILWILKMYVNRFRVSWFFLQATTTYVKLPCFERPHDLIPKYKLIDICKCSICSPIKSALTEYELESLSYWFHAYHIIGITLFICDICIATVDIQMDQTYIGWDPCKHDVYPLIQRKFGSCVLVIRRLSLHRYPEFGPRGDHNIVT